MKIKALQRSGATFVVLLFALASIVSLAPAAYAQVDVGDATDAVKDATGPVEDTVKDAVGDPTDVVEGTVDAPAGEDGPVEEVIDAATTEVDKATGGVSKPVTDELRNITDETLGPVDDMIGDTLGTRSGRDPRIGSGDTQGALSRDVPRTRTDDTSANVRGTRFQRTSDDRGANTVNEVSRPGATRTSTIESLGERATRIAQEVAFPLILLAMVAAFLIIQSRLDKKDPKLALAPLDIDEQYLIFR